MANISINNVTIVGKSIRVGNNCVFVDGVNVTPDAKEINIVVSGDVEKIEVDACGEISVTGNAGSIESASGPVRVGGNVSGDVKTVSAPITCGNISGNASSVSGPIIRK